MANDRIYLRCKCKKDEGVFLGKHFGDGWYLEEYNGAGTKIPEINKYYDKHIECFFEWKGHNLEVVYEDE